LEVRLGSLTRLGIGKVLQCRRSIPSIEHLFKVPAVIELDCLPPEQACLLTLFLLSSIREHLKTAPKPSMVPRYVIIIEEAHNIVARDTNAAPSPDVADPKVFSAEAVSRALIEFRGLGVSLVIIDQSPSKIAPDVIKATTTKLAFRLVQEEDREVLGASMLFEKLEFEEIARLLPGEAFLFTEGFYKPRRIRTVNLHERFRLK
jgi:DNA helicase HerA-like ATPase